MTYDQTQQVRSSMAADPWRRCECGRSRAERLTTNEAVGLFGYGRPACETCLLTDVRRAPELR